MFHLYITETNIVIITKLSRLVTFIIIFSNLIYQSSFSQAGFIYHYTLYKFLKQYEGFWKLEQYPTMSY